MDTILETHASSQRELCPERKTDRNDIRKMLFKSLRPLPLMHEWKFWYDKYMPSSDSKDYKNNLTEIAQFNTDFWRIYNNIPMEISSRDSIHMFKKGVKPRWEDPRNQHGGAWTFRVSKEKTNEIFAHILLMLIGESLSDTLQKDDDICGVSLSVRFSSNTITLWNRVAPTSLPLPSISPTPQSCNLVTIESLIPQSTERGVVKLKDALLAELPNELKPQGWFYRVYIVRPAA